MKITNYRHYLEATTNSPIVKKSLVVANALATELLNYGIFIDEKIIRIIATLPELQVIEICKEISGEYTIGALNPPLFTNWESRTFYSVSEFVFQIFGYMFEISGNDLQDENFLLKLKEKIDFTNFKKIVLVSPDEAREYIENLFTAEVSQDKATFQKLVNAAKYINSNIAKYIVIKSDEARIAVLMELSKYNTLLDSFEMLHCKPADVLRYAAAKKDFNLVKLPAEVKYANLSWRERIDSLSFLSFSDFEYLSEAFGTNRGAWIKYFSHIHLLSQKGFKNRFKQTALAFFVANGNRLDNAPETLVSELKSLIASKIVELTAGGTLAYRTFASRLQSAIESQDFATIKTLAGKRPNHILRNLTAVANGITTANNEAFTNLIIKLIGSASPDVLFSILSIDVNAKWRIIDIKGNTVVEPANYNPVIGVIQSAIKAEIYRRWGYDGKVMVDPELQNKIVPFLAKNCNLQRGTKFSVQKNNFLYFFVHWVQNAERTDLDHSFICFDKDWQTSMVWYGRQANDYIAQSGDITNAPAPNGATEYGKISLKEIPSDIRYIIPIVNVFTGSMFSENKLVNCGFWSSNVPRFNLSREHNSFNLDHPAMANVPFVFDVHKMEILLLDLNIREQMSHSAHGYAETVKNAILATETKHYVSIQNLAEMLSGVDRRKVSLKITEKADNKNEITPDSLFSLFN